MNANKVTKVTVAMFLNAGFEFVVGDEVGFLGNSCNIVNPSRWNDEDDSDNCIYTVESLAPRKNTGNPPVAGDCVVEITYDNGMVMTNYAGLISWQLVLRPSIITSWKPSLKHLEQKMNDKQESAMNMSERDIENAFIQQEDAAVERELVESDEWVNGDECCYYNKQLQEGGNLIYVSQHPTHNDHSVVFASEEVIQFFTVPTSMLSKPLTPEQLAAKERLESAYDLYCTCGIQHETVSIEEFEDSYIDVWYAIVDKTGYRK